MSHSDKYMDARGSVIIYTGTSYVYHRSHLQCVGFAADGEVFRELVLTRTCRPTIWWYAGPALSTTPRSSAQP